MKLECERSVLLDNINIVLKAVTSRSTLPILDCILLAADAGGFKMIANDLEMGIETSYIPSEIYEQGSVALEAKIFSDIIRRLPGDSVSITVNSDRITRISSGKSEFKILGMPGEEFPYLPEVEKDRSCVVKSEALKNMIRQTIFSAAVEESKPVLTGELFDISDGVFNVVAVDGFRVSHSKIPIDTDLIHSAVIPAKTLQEVSKLLSGDEVSEVKLYFTENHVLFEMENCTVVSRLLDGDFIQYNNVFTNDYNTLITANRRDILQALERASLITSREAKKKPVNMIISDANLNISSNTEMGASKEDVAIEVDGNDLDISFNPKYLIDAIKVMEEEDITIQFISAINPCVIKPVGSEQYRYLVLPLKQRN